MICPACGYDRVPEGSRFCPDCGAALHKASQPLPGIRVSQDVGQVDGGKVVGVQVDRFAASFAAGSIVDQRSIYNISMQVGEGYLAGIVDRLIARQGLDQIDLQYLAMQPVPKPASEQIGQVIAAQKEVSGRGVPTSPQTLYDLGRLAAYKRDYGEALGYLRQATQADPMQLKAFELVVWLQQSSAMQDIQAEDPDSAIAKLVEAGTAASQTDPFDARAVAGRGSVAKALAQVAEQKADTAGREAYLAEAAQLFERAAQLDPTDPSTQVGLGNVRQFLGDLDAAIAHYRRAIELAATYGAAHHDLAAAYEAKMEADPDRADEWCQRALDAWREAYPHLQRDPGFGVGYAEQRIYPRIQWLTELCGQSSR